MEPFASSGQFVKNDGLLPERPVLQPTLVDAKHYIQQIDFSNIVNKMVSHKGWRRTHANLVCEMYRNYLWLCRKYDGQYQLPPSEEIDEFWHNHILDTKKYRHDCKMIFGKYYDHYPYFGIDDQTNFSDLEQAFSNMLKLYKEEFSTEVFRVRSIFSKLTASLKKPFLNKKKLLRKETSI